MVDKQICPKCKEKEILHNCKTCGNCEPTSMVHEFMKSI